jgi:hypothetical protein
VGVAEGGKRDALSRNSRSPNFGPVAAFVDKCLMPGTMERKKDQSAEFKYSHDLLTWLLSCATPSQLALIFYLVTVAGKEAGLYHDRDDGFATIMP